MRRELYRMCRRYLATAAAVAGGLAVLVAAGAYLCARIGLAPPPAITGDISFNEKALFINRRGGADCDVLAVGSSMTLSNLSTDAMREGLPRGTRFLNAASWGLKMAHTRRYAELMVELGRPRALIVVCGIMDFYAPTREDLFYDRDELAALLQGRRYWWTTFRHFCLTDYVRKAFEAHRSRRGRAWYTTLCFDESGGAPLDFGFPAVSLARWERRADPSAIDPHQYEELAALSDWLRARDIPLVFAQAPMRRSAISADLADAMAAHWARIAGILGARSQVFYNLHARMNAGDSLFADYSHLNREGARRFTRALVAESGLVRHLVSRRREAGWAKLPDQVDLRGSRE